MALRRPSTSKARQPNRLPPTLACVIVVCAVGRAHSLKAEGVEPVTQKRRIVRREQRHQLSQAVALGDGGDNAVPSAMSAATRVLRRFFPVLHDRPLSNGNDAQKASSLAAVAALSVENPAVPPGFISAPPAAAINMPPMLVTENETRASGIKVAQPIPTEAKPAAMSVELPAPSISVGSAEVLGLRQALDRTAERLGHVERANEQLSQQLAAMREAVQAGPLANVTLPTIGVTSSTDLASKEGITAALATTATLVPSSPSNIAPMAQSEVPLAALPPSAPTFATQLSTVPTQMLPAVSPLTAAVLAPQLVTAPVQLSQQFASVREAVQALPPAAASAAANVAVPSTGGANSAGLGDKGTVAAAPGTTAPGTTAAIVVASPPSVASVARSEAPPATLPPSASAQSAVLPAASPPNAVAVAPQRTMVPEQMPQQPALAAANVAVPATGGASNSGLGDAVALATSAASVTRSEVPPAALPPSASTPVAQSAAVPAQTLPAASPPAAVAPAPQLPVPPAQASPPALPVASAGPASAPATAIPAVPPTVAGGVVPAGELPKHEDDPALAPTAQASVDTSMPHAGPSAATGIQVQPADGVDGQKTAEEQRASTNPEEARFVRKTVVVLLLIAGLLVLAIRIASQAKVISRSRDARAALIPGHSRLQTDKMN